MNYIVFKIKSSRYFQSAFDLFRTPCIEKILSPDVTLCSPGEVFELHMEGPRSCTINVSMSMSPKLIAHWSVQNVTYKEK